MTGHTGNSDASSAQRLFALVCVTITYLLYWNRAARDAVFSAAIAVLISVQRFTVLAVALGPLG